MNNYDQAVAKARELRAQYPEMTEAQIALEVGGHFQAQEIRTTPKGRKVYFPAGPASWVTEAAHEALQ